MKNLTTIFYQFPTFALEIVHDDESLLNARFAKIEDDRPQTIGKASKLSKEIIGQLDSYCENPNFKFDLPFKFDGSLHQLKIWQLMRQIEAGNTLSYGEVAKLLGSAPRAVGGACGKNPLPVFIPCHRIIAANSGLGGFNSGNIFFNLGIKKWLLSHEGVSLK